MKSHRIIQPLRAYESRNILFTEPDGSWPIVWERAKGVHVWDADGKKYLDLTAAFGVAATGHANPKVVRAGQAQLARLPHAMGDVHPHARKAELARELSRITFERWTKSPDARSRTQPDSWQNDLFKFRLRGGRICAQNGDSRHRQTRGHCVRRRVSRTRLRRSQCHASRFRPGRSALNCASSDISCHSRQEMTQEVSNQKEENLSLLTSAPTKLKNASASFSAINPSARFWSSRFRRAAASTFRRRNFCRCSENFATSMVRCSSRTKFTPASAAPENGSLANTVAQASRLCEAEPLTGKMPVPLFPTSFAWAKR